jgi:hypothetical protein
MIEKSDFGSIQVDGKRYTTDIIIYPDGRVADNWWRKHGHRLSLADIEDLIAAEPELIVIGSGVYGRMLPETGLEEALRARGIALVIDVTANAITRFNDLQATRRIGGGFHLTC